MKNKLIGFSALLLSGCVACEMSNEMSGWLELSNNKKTDWPFGRLECPDCIVDEVTHYFSQGPEKLKTVTQYGVLKAFALNSKHAVKRFKGYKFQIQNSHKLNACYELECLDVTRGQVFKLGPCKVVFTDTSYKLDSSNGLSDGDRIQFTAYGSCH